MATVEDLRGLGYDVSNSATGVLYICGYGSAIYVREDDRETIDTLADPVLHAERVAQFEAPEAAAVRADPVVAAVPLPKDATLADVIAAVNELRA